MSPNPTPSPDKLAETPDLDTLLRRMLNKHFSMAADEHKENASDSSVRKHYDEANAAEQTFRDALAALVAERDAARAESLEQSRLLGAGGSREAKLLAELQQLRAENERLKDALDVANRSANEQCELKRTAEEQLTHLKAELERANGLLDLVKPSLCDEWAQEAVESHLNPKKTP